MAIPRAQQVKQMLREGGRIGLRSGSFMDSGEVKESRRKSDFDASANRVAAATNIESMEQALGSGIGPKTKEQQEARDRLRDQRDTTIDTIKDRNREKPTFIDRTRNKLIQSSINKNKVLALRKLGLLPKPSISPMSAIFQSLQPIPEQFEDLSEEDLLKIATSGPYLSQQKTVGDVNKFTSGKDLLGRTFEAEDLLREGNMTQDKFEELFPGPNIPDDRDSDQQLQETDPCKGPNPPAYCFIGEKANETIEAQRNLGGLAPRIAGSIFDFTGMADGGRIGAAEGGIMDLETGRQMYFLGKLVKKASRAIKTITKSPIGKAAILGGLGYFGLTKTGFGANLLKDFGKLSSLKKAGIIGGGLLTAAPFFMKEEEEEDDPYRGPDIDIANIRSNPYNFLAPRFAADGGLMRMGYQEGSKEPVAKKTMPLLDMGGKEMDLRDNGGFVPIGRMEKADDVPARLSKNEFVFTADAVRNAGEGDVDKGAEVMYNMMKNLESGGQVSEESQGLEGARDMFQTSKRLEEVL